MSSTTTISSTVNMAEQWAKDFEQFGITDNKLKLDKRWLKLGFDESLLESIDMEENDNHIPVKAKIEVVV